MLDKIEAELQEANTTKTTQEMTITNLETLIQ